MLRRPPNPGTQDGFAVPVTLLMLIASFAVVSVGVVASINTQRGTVRDQGTKSALQLAEAGVSEAMLHYNRIQISPSNPCSPLTSSPPNAQGWCPAVSGSDVGGAYSYQVRPSNFHFGLAGTLEVVATGTTSNASGASRRVYISAESASGQPIFGQYGVQMGDSISMGSNAEVHSSAATNGDMVLSSNAKQCGQASVGQGHNLTLNGNSQYHGNTDCSGTATVNHDPVSLPPVNQGDVVTNNDNGRLFGQDLISGGSNQRLLQRPQRRRHSRQLRRAAPRPVRQLLGDARRFQVQLLQDHDEQQQRDLHRGGRHGLDLLRLAGGLRLLVRGGAARHELELADSPRRPAAPRTSRSSSWARTRCRRTSCSRATRTSARPASRTSSSTRRAADIVMNSNSTFCGAIAGKSLQMDSNARVYSSTGAQNFEIPATAAHYSVERFVDCDATPGANPSSGC